ncbi:DUF5808 domain-containing protein [Corynebacterium sp.]|uniref:DUF5808 domain-containing protein n=1 Tax=Corynebacterium sp. TaxID=1720 RepID=UPI0026DB897D|nr:DUF5808 domain-containing protein [Corynebacterium sp.]MDO4610060.1 hypothetical protein [Corynebacterium sp.]
MTTTETTRSGRILGVPWGVDGFVRREARLRSFEPENPALLVPRSAGIGWDLNTGAVAVRLGLIRPDDSLPDLEAHIPGAVARALSAAPLAGAAVVAAVSVAAGRGRRRMPTGWGANLAPRGWGTPVRALAPGVAVSAGLAAWNAWRNRAEGSVDVSGASLALTVEAGALVLAVAARAAGERDDVPVPARARLLAGLGVAAVPAVATAVPVAVVKSALANLGRRLASGDSPVPA